MLLRHYEKIIVGCCFLSFFANVGLTSTAFSVHQPFIVAIPGIGDTGGSLILSTRTLVSLVVMVFVDRYYRLLDVRLGLLIANLFTVAGFFAYSHAVDLPSFLIGAVLLGLAYGLGGMVSITYLVNRWYTNGIGTVVGFVSMGSGLASIAMPLIVVRIIEASSLSVAFMVESGIALTLGLIVFALIRNRPSDVGLAPYEKKPSKRGGARTRLGRKDDTPLPKGERIAILAAMVGVGAFCCCGMTYMSVLATSSGFDAIFAATLVSVAGAALTAGKFVSGELFDHLGAARASALMFALAIVGFVLCCFVGSGSHVLMLIAAVLVGAGLSLGTVGISIWSLDMSDAASRTKEIKNFQVAYALGGFVANTLPGIVKDLVGSYVVSYAAAAVIAVAATIVVLRYYRINTRR